MTDGQSEAAQEAAGADLRLVCVENLLIARRDLRGAVDRINTHMDKQLAAQDAHLSGDTWNLGDRSERHDAIVAHLKPHGRGTVQAISRALGFTPDEVRLLAANSSDLVWFHLLDGRESIRMFADAKTADATEGDHGAPIGIDAQGTAGHLDGDRPCNFEGCECSNRDWR